MNTNTAPDLLLRFVPTPHVFSFCRDDVHLRIETNDLNIALAVRKFCMLPSKGEQQTVLLWKFIRDRMAPPGDMELTTRAIAFQNISNRLTTLSDGPLRTLLLDTGTMITFDRERHEILGFLAPEVTAEQLVMTLIPLLIDGGVEGQGKGKLV